MGEFSDAALLLIGHGSTSDPEAAAPIYQHAAQLRKRGLFALVREAFWKQDSGLQGLLETIQTPRVFIQPVFLSEGYFTQEAIPRALGLRTDTQAPLVRLQQRGSQTFYYCDALGTHSSVTNVILARAEEVLDQNPFPRRPAPEQTALFVVGHGTPRNENSRRAVEEHVAGLRTLKRYAEVHAVFMEEVPGVGDCYHLALARNLIVVPFLISDGPHSRRDIPVLLGEAERTVQERLQRRQAAWRNPTEKHGKLVWYSNSVGTDPHLADVICQRVAEATAWSRQTT